MRKHVLVVDDESDVREAVRLLLEVDNHSVVEANNGAEALGVFREGSFDLVMIDQQMPHVLGNELAAHIRKLAPAQPIVMLTGNPPAPGIDNPVDAVIQKPLTISALRRTMARLLKLPGLARECAPGADDSLFRLDLGDEGVN